MNCKQFNNILLEEILSLLGYFPTQNNEKEAWYLNPFAQENHASFKINKRLNYWYLFSEGIGGNNIDFMKKYLNSSVKGVLEWVEKKNISSFPQQNGSVQKSQKPQIPLKNYEIIEVKEVQHPALLNYLKTRNLERQKSELKEIYYLLNGKKYFGLAFKNDSEGYEIRNPYSKICLGKKDVSTVKNGRGVIRIFEGFTDYLSFKCLEKILEKEPSGYLILNSVSMISKIQNSLEKYKTIELYLDNDRAGNLATQQLMTFSKNIKDERLLYQNHKDLNEYLVNHEMKKIMSS